MNSPDSRHLDLPIDNGLDELILEVLAEDYAGAEPPPLVWARIQAEIEADQVPLWVAWSRRLRIACADTLPRIVPQAVVVTLFVLLGGLSLQGYDWFATVAPATGSPTTQRQITTAERRFYEQYRTKYYVVPVDAPPKGVPRAEPRPPAPSVGPRHLAVGVLNPS